MKKIFGIVPLFALLILAGCQTTTNNPQEILPDVSGAMDYSGELVVAGIGPDVSLEPTVAQNALVMKKTFEDHSDHVFFPANVRDKSDNQSDFIPGNRFYFIGKVNPLDAAAGNHYYSVVSILELKKIGTPTKEEVVNLLDQYSYCESDSDCTTTYGKCPLPCHITFNARYSGAVESIIDNFRNNQESQCMYKCMEIKSVTCNAQHKCEAK